MIISVPITHGKKLTSNHLQIKDYDFNKNSTNFVAFQHETY